ncbi:MAG: DUF1549 domain-containing protein [Planctomycetota bacterium]|jgi:mono/diheme cytochrome c family protein
MSCRSKQRLPIASALAAAAVSFFSHAPLLGAVDDVPTSTPTAKAEPAKVQFFESKIRPLLAKRCFKCHGEEKQKGGLRVDAGANLLKGGESGPSIVPGKPDESLLIESVRYESFEMPPDGQLPEAEIALLEKWVADGAFWPAHDAELRNVASEGGITDEDRNWWAFQPVQRPQVPGDAGAAWARNEIDRFVARNMARNDLTPAPEADRRTLIRRLYFDLTGLPPSPDEVEEFISDPAADAYERLVDRLLDSPRYGERWARHWLDLVRYSESDGYRADFYRPTMWRYRDYVIRSFNDDKPFDQFVAEQIAGDELDPDNPDAVTATAYWRLYLYEYNQRDVRGHWRAIIDELTDVTGEVFLGVSMGCAKCHDHKFDPILRDDYFRLQAFFSSILPRDDVPLGTAEQKAAHEAQQQKWLAATESIRDQIDAVEAPYKASKRRSAVEKFPPDVRDIAKREPDTWNAHERQLMDLVQRQIDFEYERMKLKDDDQKKVDELKKQLAEFDELKPQPLPVTQTVTDAGREPSTTWIPGDRSHADIPPGFLTVLTPGDAAIEPVPGKLKSSGRRSALARWLTNPGNPLATRVIANRIWQYHFGSGLVETSSDFGHLGEPPSHPELLDWLTDEFLRSGWSFKAIHRLICQSATYRQSAFHPDANRNNMVDPRNRLLWRWSIRRLDAEQIRDAMLAASGELDLKDSGPAVDATKPRRSVFTKIIRNKPDPLLKSFDVSDGINSTARRQVTTTPTQSLLMINGTWSLERARALGRTVDAQIAGDNSLGTDTLQQAVTAAIERTLGRDAAPREVEAGIEFLRDLIDRPEADRPLVGALAGMKSPAAIIREEDTAIQWKLADQSLLPNEDFTIEAVIELQSLYPDASVRTIAANWNGSTGAKGWGFGVTSTKSAYQPRNLILQLVGGEPAVAGTGKPTYEVIPSNLRPELNRPYYAAVSVDVDDASESGVTFYLKDLSNEDAPMQTASVKHKVTGDFRPDLSFALGARAGSSRSRWNGLVTDVRLSATRLTEEELLVNGGEGRNVVGHWNFTNAEQPGRDASGNNHDLKIYGAPTATRSGIPEFALTDFCHVLLNSNEFLYVD